MEQETQITNIEELIDWITFTHRCFSVDIEDNGLYIQAPNNAGIFISIEKDDDIDDIISRTIERFEDFDTDEQFMELWSKDFAEHNHFKPSQFIRMLQEDEKSFHNLAKKLRRMIDIQ